MSSLQPTVYGQYEYAKQKTGATTPGNLYGNSFVPQSTTLNFAESISEADALHDNISKVLTESMTLFDSSFNRIVRNFSETVTPTDIKVFFNTKVFAEFMIPLDSTIQFHIIKNLNDILLVQDWFSIRLQKQNIWNTGVLSSNSKPTLYGAVKYGTSIYAGDGLLSWIEVKPSQPSAAGWKSFNQLEGMN